ncbi:MAG TPA: 3'(2'),5'-bisphosphate nucleotidase CysQ [Rhodobacterales bacterium]|nr:3'(2'),5'-bisphosphate nucleotidase CysQ [Rhodobacterales bacterium]
MPEADDLSLLVEAARAAGDISRGYFKRAPKTWEKPGSGGPVTEADLAVNEMLEERLRAARPGYGWLSEESPDDPARLEAARAFIIDPLDGTRAFIEGDHGWTHSLAVVDRGQVHAAVIYQPMTDRIYTAAQGHGAHRDGEKITVSSTEALDGATILASRTNFEPWHWKEARVPSITRRFRSSLAYRLGLVGEGRFDAMLNLRPTFEWDVAAGALIVAEAGGRVTDRLGAAPRFNRPDPMLNGIIAAGPRIHAEIAERLV